MREGVYQRTKLAKQRVGGAIEVRSSGADRVAKMEIANRRRERRIEMLGKNNIKTGYRFRIEGGKVLTVKIITKSGELLLDDGSRIDPLKIKVKKRK